ncbi:hypothetical protein [Thermospira aquatica]|uniref:TIGR02677 family protein n=1 Tax=Thermospira aquatica TaxID=2828656 RepID=A0AAX3BDY4_9SPIR|nr:hypothetical protein [Thermospira aquatica]URA10558.1 hypothetical protein KDW03_01785 [Thermospira aquatica]
MSNERERIDDIRQRLKMKELSESEKKQLFQKFIDAGGEVIDLDAQERRALKKTVRTVSREREQRIAELEKAEKKISRAKKTEESNPVSQWIELTAARITCVLLGLIRWNGRQLKESFVNFLLYDFQNTLLQIKMILASLLYQDKAITAEIRQMMLADSAFPFGYELIYRLDKLYEEEYFKFLSEHKMDPESLFENLEVLKAIYRNLFVIQNYQTSLKLAVEKALLKEGEIRRLNSRITEQNIKSLFMAIDMIYEKVADRFYTLMEYAYRLERQKKKITFRDFLGMKPEDVLGYYTDQWKEEMQKAMQEAAKKQVSEQGSSGFLFAEEENAVAKNVLESLNEYIQKGISFINERIHWREKLMEYESNRNPKAVYTVNDKIFLVEHLLELYESEFSFLFTSTRVQFNYLLVDGKRLDMKKELVDLYYKTMPLRDRFNEYLRILKEIRSVEKEAFLSVVEKSSRLNQLSIQRSQVSRQIRRDLRDIFEQYSGKWLFILSRTENESPVIQNMSEVLKFDRKLEGERWSNGRTIREAVEMAYSLADTIHFLLLGELGGNSLLIEKSLYLKI